jgi:hypothetical protein
VLEYNFLNVAFAYPFAMIVQLSRFMRAVVRAVGVVLFGVALQEKDFGDLKERRMN